MENCIYQGKIICTFDLKDDNGLYYEDIVLDWKQAAAERQLICTECGAHVYLAAGPIKEPYFAHYDLENCEYGSGHESEELKKGKRLLYQLFRRSFPGSDIQVRFRMENGLYSTLYCILEEGRSLAVDYRLCNNSLEKFRERDTFYQANHIKPVYVMSKRQDKTAKQIDWYQNLLQSSMGYLIFLDSDQEELTLKKSFGYRLGNIRKFEYCVKTYSIKELKLDSDGNMICDFSNECEKVEMQIQEEKAKYQRRQDQLKKLRIEREILAEKDRKQQEAYRRAKEQQKEAAQEIQKLSIQQIDEKTVGNQSISDFEGLNPILLEKCRKMIEEGNAHLVSKKYYDAIMHGQK